jgi:plastocyanin
VRHTLGPLLLLLTTATSALAGPVSGTVRTSTAPGARPASTIVYAEPMDVPPPGRPGRFTMEQKDKTFRPHVLAIPVGSTVEFPNADPIFHNVFSLSGPEPFDLGLYRSGESRSRLFTVPASYRVFCNIHPQMAALIVVVPTPYVTVVTDGRYVLDLPPGRYRLTALSDRAEAVTAEVVSTAGAVSAPELVLDESGYAATPHKNKHGQDYPAAAYRP